MDYGMKHILGNLYEGTYAGLFCGEEANRIKEDMRQNDGNILCRSCSNAWNNQKLACNYIKYKEDATELWKAKIWFERQIENYKDENTKLRNWCEELTRAKDYNSDRAIQAEKNNIDIEKQYKKLENQNKELEDQYKESKEHYKELENQYNELKSEEKSQKKQLETLQKMLQYEKNKMEKIKKHKILKKIIEKHNLDI